MGIYLFKNLFYIFQCITFAYELIQIPMKTESIIVRVDKDMKDKLVKLAQDNRRELSDFLRLVMEDLIKKKIKV